MPKAIRDALGAVPGDELVFQQRDGEVVVHHRRRRSIMELAGIAMDTAPDPGLTPNQLRAAVEQEVGARHARWVRDAKAASGRPRRTGVR
ncbi:MAG: hypothetical protein R3C32_03455 [Chloroflexota bacterium]